MQLSEAYFGHKWSSPYSTVGKYGLIIVDNHVSDMWKQLVFIKSGQSHFICFI